MERRLQQTLFLLLQCIDWFMRQAVLRACGTDRDSPVGDDGVLVVNQDQVVGVENDWILGRLL